MCKKKLKMTIFTLLLGLFAGPLFAAGENMEEEIQEKAPISTTELQMQNQVNPTYT